MSQLDKLIERLQPQQEILLETGKEPMMRTRTGAKAMLNQVLTTPQIIALLTEIAPITQKQNITQKKPTNFEYQYNAKSHTIMFMAQGEQVRAVISQADGAKPVVEPEIEPEIAPESDSGIEQDDFEPEVIPEEPEVPSAPPTRSPAAKPAAGGPEPEINVLLRKMFGMSASDLHLTSNHKPMIRLHGDMQELPDQPAISPERMKKLIYRIMPPHNATQYEDTHDTDFAHEIPGLARFRVNVFMDRFGHRRGVPADPHGDRDRREARALQGDPRPLLPDQRPRPGHRARRDRANPRRSARSWTSSTATARTTSSPSRTPSSSCTQKKNCLINQREVHVHTKSFSQRAPGRAPRGPRHRARGRDARPRDHRHRHRDGGNGPPGVRHAPHHHRGVHRGPHHRPVPGGPAVPDPDHAGQLAQGGHLPDALQEERPRAGSPPWKSCS